MLWYKDKRKREIVSKKLSKIARNSWKIGVYDKINYSKIIKDLYKKGILKSNGKKVKKAWKDGKYNQIDFSKATKKMWNDGVFKNKHSSNSKKMLELWKKGVYDEVIKKTNEFRCIKYKGYSMRSGWEVKYAKWLDKNKIAWNYEIKVFKLSNGKRYLPDFYLPKKRQWTEIKGRFYPEAKEKIIKFRKDYPREKLIVLRYKELKNANII